MFRNLLPSKFYRTVTVTVFGLPHTEEKVTLPLVLFTWMVNVFGVLPETVAEVGVTRIWPLLLEVAVMVPVPTKLTKLTPTVPDLFWPIVIAVGLVIIEQGTGVGVGVGDG